MSRKARSPSLKRIKLETPLLPATPKSPSEANDIDAEEPEFQCSICLQDVVDRTVIPTCFHEFCFECITMWAEQSRRCPLCSQSLGDHLLHNIRSKYDFRKHYLPPLRKSPVPERNVEFRQRQRTVRERERERRLWEEREASDRLARSIEKRRWIYRHNLYAKHVASNAYTRYRPYPIPAQFAASNDLITRTTIFLRRELQVWENIDVEFLTTFIISLMKSIDIRSESAVKLLAEFLDLDVPYVEGGRYVNAEHFAHEVYSFVRSPFRDLFVYDNVVQYDVIDEEPPPAQLGRRWGSVRHSRSRSPHPPSGNTGPSRDRSVSCSPSGRHHPTYDVQPTQESSADRRNRRRPNKTGRRASEQTARNHTRTNANDARDTSRRPEDSAKGKERERPGHATATNHIDVTEGVRFEVESPAAESPVAQSSAQSYTPALSPRPSMIRPGHRFLAQSVQTHLKRGSDKQLGGPKGMRPGRHLDSPLLAHLDSSSVALLARLSDPPLATQRNERSPELNILMPSQRAAVRHGASSDNKTPDNHLLSTEPIQSSSSEAIAPTRPFTARAVVNSQTTVTTPPPVNPPDHRSHPTPSSALMSAIDLMEPPLPPTPPSVGGSATSTSETLFHQEAMSNGHHTGITLRGSPINDSTHPPVSHQSHSTTFQSRKNLLGRLEREKLRAQCFMAKGSTDVLEPMDETLTTGFNGQHMISIGPEQTQAIDPRAIETKLRKRAQLQVRLAAEKRSTGL